MSKVTLKNTQQEEFSIETVDNSKAITVKTTDFGRNVATVAQLRALTGVTGQVAHLTGAGGQNGLYL